MKICVFVEFGHWFRYEPSRRCSACRYVGVIEMLHDISLDMLVREEDQCVEEDQSMTSLMLCCCGQCSTSKVSNRGGFCGRPSIPLRDQRRHDWSCTARGASCEPLVGSVDQFQPLDCI
ncbi:hypothetical protein Dimus_002348 [Dionaea muscipula]